MDLAVNAGRTIAEIYNNENMSVQEKADGSPVTRADMAAHEIIMQGLKSCDPNGVIISEESYAGESLPADGWLVDPLDGTKEFIAGSADFTVNIAYIKNRSPVFGVIYAPAHDRLYWGGDGGAFMQHDGTRRKITTKNRDEKSVIICTSLRHDDSNAIKNILQQANIGAINNTLKMGSSLKFCRVADGTADIYVRLSPTNAWDSAAGIAILKAAGGYIYDLSGGDYAYGDKPLGGGFVASGDTLPPLF